MLFDIEEIKKTEKPCAGNFPKKDLKPALEAAQKGSGKERVFSNGSGADDWMHHNCHQCRVPNGDNRRVNYGLDCIGEYCTAIGFITGSIPFSVVEHFGIGQPKCKQFQPKKK